MEVDCVGANWLSGVEIVGWGFFMVFSTNVGLLQRLGFSEAGDDAWFFLQRLGFSEAGDDAWFFYKCWASPKPVMTLGLLQMLGFSEASGNAWFFLQMLGFSEASEAGDDAWIFLQMLSFSEADDGPCFLLEKFKHLFSPGLYACIITEFNKLLLKGFIPVVFLLV